MNNRTYVIIDSSLVESEDFDFSLVMETSASTLRYSVDGTKTFVKFVGEVPSFLEGLTLRNHDEIRAVLATEEWQAPHEPE